MLLLLSVSVLVDLILSAGYPPLVVLTATLLTVLGIYKLNALTRETQRMA